MSGVAVAGTKGSAGVTTLAFGLAAVRAGEALVIEGDPDGGCLAARLGISEDPGLASVAAASRHGTLGGPVDQHVQTSRGVQVLPAPSAPRQARACLSTSVANLDVRMWWASRRSVIDCGRLDADSPLVDVATGASVVLWVTRPNVEGADALAVRLAEVPPKIVERSALVTSGEGPYHPEEVAAALHLPLLGHLPFDPRGAASLWADAAARGWRRRPLGRAVSAVSAASPDWPVPGTGESDGSRTLASVGRSFKTAGGGR